MSNQNGDRHATNIRPEQLTAYALGQLEGEELAAVEQASGERQPPASISAQPRDLVAETRRLADALRTAAQDETPDRSPELRAAILSRLEERTSDPVELPPPTAGRRRAFVWLAAGTAAAVLGIAIALPAMRQAVESPANTQVKKEVQSSGLERKLQTDSSSPATTRPFQSDLPALPGSDGGVTPIGDLLGSHRSTTKPGSAAKVGVEAITGPLASAPYSPGEMDPLQQTGVSGMAPGGMGGGPQERQSYRDYIESELTTLQGRIGSQWHNGHGGVVRSAVPSEQQVAELESRQGLHGRTVRELHKRIAVGNEWESRGWAYGNYGREQYERIVENGFLSPTEHPLSTFSIDVDTASYSNVRRFLTGGRLPPPAAVRIEELINYFSYSYPQPKAGEPFSVTMETTQCPWQPGNLLLRVGLKGKEIHRAERPPSNLVFLLDVSGSMADENKLPLLKTALELLVAELTENDRVSIVTYAGEAGLRLAPTRGHEKQRLLEAIGSLSAGGSTHGSAGIQLAYEQAGQYFLKEGTNRVILATDGDLNVGVTQDDALVELIKSKAAGGTFLTVLGFGEGNLQDAKLEKLADNGNGHYAYIDSVREARKVLVEELSSSTVAIAKDVKIQIEFNPQEIAAYRLLGYENRVLAAKDFSDDTKDAGEVGAGHTVTALYELVPAGAARAAPESQPGVEPLKYQARGQRSEVRGQNSDIRNPTSDSRLTEAAASGELLTLKLRYKEPDGQVSKLLELVHKDRGGSFNSASKDLQFAAAVASFGMILRGSEHKGGGTLSAVSEIASGAQGEDPSGYRAEFVDLVRQAQALGEK